MTNRDLSRIENNTVETLTGYFRRIKMEKKPRKPRTRTEDAQVKPAVVKELRRWKLPVIRQNAGRIRTPGGGFIQLAPKGAADLSTLLPPNGTRLEVELKRPGGRVRPEQVEWGKLITSLGGIYIVVHSASEMRSFLEEYFNRVRDGEIT